MAATKTVEKAIEASVVKDDILDVLEDSLTTLEDSLTLIEDRISWAAKNRNVLWCGAILLGASAASAVTYLVVSKRLSKKWQAHADKQIADVKANYTVQLKPDLKDLADLYDTASDDIPEDVVTSAVAKSEVRAADLKPSGRVAYDKVTPDKEAVKDLVSSVTQNPIIPTQPPFEVSQIVERNVFASDDPEKYFDWTEEMARRNENPEKPHVVTRAEFDANEMGNEQAHYTFYEGDGVLCNEMDQPITDEDEVVGSEQLVRFGHGSENPNLVFVRNMKLGLDIEIAKSDHSYSEDVLGFHDESSLQHSSERRSRYER